MKLSVGFYILITSAVLVALVVMAFLEVTFAYMLYTTIAGQILLIIMVYKILTDDYTTSKSFEDWYEDRPLNKE